MSIDLADKDYYNTGTKITWNEFFNVEKQTRDYIEQTLGYVCPESDYDVFYFDLTELNKNLKFRYIFVLGRGDYNESKILRTGDFVVRVSDSPSGTYFMPTIRCKMLPNCTLTVLLILILCMAWVRDIMAT